MYDAGQKTCMSLIEEGYVHTFEEILNLMSINKKVREEAEHGLDKTMPKSFTKESKNLSYIEVNLKNAEDAMRKGEFEENYRSRLQLGQYFHGLEGYHWLAEYFYKSTQLNAWNVPVDAKLDITFLQQQAFLEENRGNLDIAVKYLEKALRIAKKNSLYEDATMLKLLNDSLCRMYQQLGTQYLEKEIGYTDVQKSVILKFVKKAAKFARMSDNLETQAECQALLGKAMLKFNDDDFAQKSFETYIELREKGNNIYGMCQGYFAISEIFKRNGDLDKSVTALNKCQDLAREHHFDIPFIFSSISLGQIATAKRQYFTAKKHFEEAYNETMGSKADYENRRSLKKLSKVMFGIGKAYLTFNSLIASLHCPTNLSMLKLLTWRNTGGAFTGHITQKEDHLIDLEEVEKEGKQAGISEIIEKLMIQELHGE